MFVAALSPDALIARRNKGKTSGGTMTIGWRMVRITDRQARERAWVRRAGVTAAAVTPGLPPVLWRARLYPPPHGHPRGSDRSLQGRRRRAWARGPGDRRP